MFTHSLAIALSVDRVAVLRSCENVVCVCVYSNAVDVCTPLISCVFMCICVYVLVCMNAFVRICVRECA